MNTAAHPAHVSSTQTSSQWSTPVSAQWLNISFRIRGSWSMQMPFRKEKVFTRTHTHTHTLAYTVSFPHGALQHKDCRLFIWEKFAHVFPPPFVLRDVLWFYYNYYDFLSIWKRKNSLLSARSSTARFVRSQWRLMILHLQKMRKSEKRSDDHTSYHIRNHGLLSLLHFHKLATFFKPPGCERNFIFWGNFWQGSLQFVQSFFFPINEKSDSS